MTEQWYVDLERTKIAFELIKDKIFHNKVDLVSVEGQNSITMKWLDQYSGIDIIGRKNDNHLVTIASRIQWNKNYKTFTIRYERITGAKTEFEKRIEAIQKGYLYPNFTMQAYINETPLQILSWASIKTDIFYKYLIEHPEIMFERTANYEGNKFKYIYWSDISHLESFKNG